MAAFYTFSDHSGLAKSDKEFSNPYDILLDQCKSSDQIQALYDRHRTNRNAQQKEKLLAAAFSGVTVDEILARLEDPASHPGYEDPRNCLVFWARPTDAVKSLIAEVQKRLVKTVPGLWTMPQDCLHMTALEVTHSLTAPEIDALVAKLAPKRESIADYTATHQCRLVKPLVSFDAQAIAMSFLPAAGEPEQLSTSDSYTYHHLRRDLFHEVQAAGVAVASRYVVPSAHLTIGRFIKTSDFEDHSGMLDRSKVQQLVATLEGLNAWLQQNYWPGQQSYANGGEWLVGQERGLTHRKGRLWYGGGETVYQGRGF